MLISFTPTGMLIWSAACMAVGALITLRVQKLNRGKTTASK